MNRSFSTLLLAVAFLFAGDLMSVVRADDQRERVDMAYGMPGLRVLRLPGWEHASGSFTVGFSSYSYDRFRWHSEAEMHVTILACKVGQTEVDQEAFERAASVTPTSGVRFTVTERTTAKDGSRTVTLANKNEDGIGTARILTTRSGARYAVYVVTHWPRSEKRAFHLRSHSTALRNIRLIDPR